jgi:hypothetical protein
MSGDAMSEAHVEKLFYRVLVPEHTDYETAASISGETEDFNWNLSKDQLVIEIKAHYQTEDEAREAIDQYLKAWEVMAALHHAPECLTFSFDRSEVSDQPPRASDSDNIELNPSASEVIQLSDVLRFHESHSDFPAPPEKFRLSPETEMMFDRYKLYRAGRESLLGTAYWCLTVVEYSARGKEEAADQYRIDLKVLRKLGELCGNRRDTTGAGKLKKQAGITPLKSTEREWIRSVVKRLILRAGEYSFDPNAKLPQITVSDFPGVQ